jgi:hypothetical protein
MRKNIVILVPISGAPAEIKFGCVKSEINYFVSGICGG